MLCMKDYKVKSLHKHLINCQRNSYVIQNKNVSEKKFNMHKKKDEKGKLNKLVEEMQKKSSEQENNACMKKL